MHKVQWGLALTILFLRVAAGLALQAPAEDDGLGFHAPEPRLEEFIREALTRNPQLRRALADYRAAIQKIPQVTALPDPMLTFTRFLRSPETRVGPQTSGLMLSQRFPWFGKLDLQGKMAVRDASSMYETYRGLERRLAADVKKAFYELAYVDRAIEIAQEEQQLLEHFEQLAETRYATGGGLQHDVIKVQTEITKILNRTELLYQQRASAAARLNTLRSLELQEPIGLVEPLSVSLVDLDLDTLYALGEANRPELRAALDAIEKNQLAAERARKDYWPDLTLSASLVNVDGREDPGGLTQPPPDNGKNVYSFSVGINIPIRRDKYRAAELAAVERVVAGRDHYAAVADEMKFEIREQVIRIETLIRQMELYDQIFTPQAESALASAETAYETGLVGSLELLDSERLLLDVRLAQARFVSDAMQALATLERAVGTRYPAP